MEGSVSMNPTYYDGTKLLSKRDLDGNRPELYLCCGNRTGGKTTYFSRMLVNRFLTKREKFIMLLRFQTELDDISNAFFNDIKGLFFHNLDMTHQLMGKGKYALLLLDEQICGYAVPLNAADYVKKKSHIFNDVTSMFMDEFQSETNHYASGEVTKFISLHTSVARGQGKQVRYVPVYMASNSVTLLNPYFVALGISSRLTKNASFLRGHGWVLEQAFVETASQAQKESAFNRAFSNDKYIAYSSENIYLNDNMNFIEPVNGKNRYVATIRYKGKLFSIKEFQREGILYVDTSYDLSYPCKLSLTTEDHQLNYVMLMNNMDLVLRLRFFFTRGCFRFKNLECKEMLLNMLSF